MDEGHYILRTDGDAELLKLWHTIILPSVTTRPEHYLGLRSMHLLRQGPNEEDATPVIFVSVKSTGSDLGNYTPLREKISMLFEEPLRLALRISFDQSAMRRTMDDGDPPICQPRNAHFQVHPQGGASIGIKHQVKNTATLGGFLIVDGHLYILTVDHFIPDYSEGRAPIPRTIWVTHTSEQEPLYTRPWTEIADCLPFLNRCCNFCRHLFKKHAKESDFYRVVNLTEYGEEKQCLLAQKFRDLKNELRQKHPIDTLGIIVHRSYTRSRAAVWDKGNYQVEMDWALVTANQWPVSLEEHTREQSKSLHLSRIKPGVKVKATGRTSGLHFGQISNAMSVVRYGVRLTQEWSVIKDPECSWKEWIEGGIGVDGDSGSWVIDRENGAVYGMVWARDKVMTKPICLFSPMEEIVADIKERTGARHICLPGEEQSPTAPEVDKPMGVDIRQTSPIRGHRLSEDSYPVTCVDGLHSIVTSEDVH